MEEYGEYWMNADNIWDPLTKNTLYSISLPKRFLTIVSIVPELSDNQSDTDLNKKRNTILLFRETCNVLPYKKYLSVSVLSVYDTSYSTHVNIFIIYLTFLHTIGSKPEAITGSNNKRI